MRVPVVDLARELEMRASDLIYLAEEAGVHIARIGSTVTEPQAQKIRNVAKTMHVTRQGSRRVVRPRESRWPSSAPAIKNTGLTHTIGDQDRSGAA